MFKSDGTLEPITVLRLEKTVFCGRKSAEKDGYIANIFARIDDKSKSPKSENGKFKNIENIKKLVEERLSKDTLCELKNGQTIDESFLKEGDQVVIEGKSKGKGFAGTVKRHGFTTGPKTHGSCNWRRPGSIGPTYPQRTIKGRNMGGHMGDTNVKIKSAFVRRISGGEVWVSGSVPGPNRSILVVRKNG